MKSTGGKNSQMILTVVVIASMILLLFPYSTSSSHYIAGPAAAGEQTTSPSSSLRGENASLTLSDLFNRTQQSVVQVSSTLNGTSLPPGYNHSNIFPSPEPPQGLVPQQVIGSGFVYDKEGHVITNSHVVMLGKDQRIDVTFPDGTVYRANITGIDQYSDLAVLHVEGIPKEKLLPLPLGNSSDLTVGQPVAAIGNPFGLSGSLSQGIVSGLDRLIPADVVPEDPFSPGNSTSSPLFSIPNVIQTDAPINPGNSGGPLLDREGSVVGINTAIFSTTGVFAGVGFAIPSNSIAKVVPALIQRGSFEHAWLGVTGTDMTPDIAKAIRLDEPRGFLVVDVDKGGPAAKAGIHGSNATSGSLGEGRKAVPLGGDVIISIDNATVRKIDDLLGYLEESTAAGQTLILTVWRNGQTMEIDVTLAPRPVTIGLQGSS